MLSLRSLINKFVVLKFQVLIIYFYEIATCITIHPSSQGNYLALQINKYLMMTTRLIFTGLL
jgi:hypothetical protein